MEPSATNGIEAKNTITDLQTRICMLQEELHEEERKKKGGFKSTGQRVLAPRTPSPKKTKHVASARAGPRWKAPATSQPQRHPAQPVSGPSNFLASLSVLNHNHCEEEAKQVARSSGFTDPPAPVDPLKFEQRDDRLAIVERLELGPQEHTPPVDDPDFKTREPNSGIHLSERRLPHDDLQEHLRGRYFLSPSTLYSIARPLPSKQGYDVPVDGDWVTIAVIAERGPVKLTSVSGTADDEKNPGVEGRLTSKKFLCLKLVDLGVSGSDAGKPARGDAVLNMLLFEATSHSKEISVDDKAYRFGKKHYKGGSGGAFEACAALREGTVLAILNPRVLKPFQRGHESNPRPGGNILAITPTSASSLLVIGQARDLGSCTATRKDGSTCGLWFDKRVSGGRAVCEWHFTAAVQGQRSSRAEFSTSTSSLKASADGRRPFQGKRGSKEDGLLPNSSQRNGADGEAVYMYSGSAIRPGKAHEVVDEKIGRGRQERLKRKRENMAAEDALAKLQKLQPDDHPAFRKVQSARAAMKLEQSQIKRKGKSKSPQENIFQSYSDQPTNTAYSIALVKNLGFNPSAKSQGDKGGDVTTQRKLEALHVASSSRVVKLGARPGRRRSALAVPNDCSAGTARSSSRTTPLDDSDIEVEVEAPEEIE